MDNYNDILESKKVKPLLSGWKVAESTLHAKLFLFQKYIVARALEAGRFAIFADCGLGKTFMQLVWANEVAKRTGKPVLILTPLAVSGQTIIEGWKLDLTVYRFSENYMCHGPELFIANYEQMHNIDPRRFAGVVLDESSILKNFTGETKKALLIAFDYTPYRLCCTATPAPNDMNELGNHSEFLGVLDAQDMRSKWFVRDDGMNNYRLKEHAKSDFYGWVSSWAVMISKPSDIGFSDDGYNLPPLNYIENMIITPKRDNGKMLNDTSINATNFNAELRMTMAERMAAAVEIVKANPHENFIIWIKHNAEGEMLRKLLPHAVEVKGSDTTEYKEKMLLGFANNEFRVLITKQKIAQFGLNYQNCHNQIFPSLDFSFEGLYQAVRRSYRFGQKYGVNIWIVTTDTMTNVVESIRRKESQHNEMQTEMNKCINGKLYGLKETYEFREVRNDYYWLMKGDSVIEIDRVPDNSVRLIIFSPPFSSLFTYSNYIHDMGNNESHEAFFKQYSFLLKKAYKKLMPGGHMVCHTKDLGVYKNSSGYTGMYDFTRLHTEAVEKENFKLHCKITIWTDPVLEMQRTKTQRLLYKTVTSDSSYTGVGMAEFLTVFRKWDGDESQWLPVNHITKNNFPLDTWQDWASPVYKENLLKYSNHDLAETILKLKAEVFQLRYGCNPDLPTHWYDDVWFDIKRTDVLNNKEGTAQGDEKHIAPLQLTVNRRCINLWSNPGDSVMTLFAGIGSEVFEAVKEGRYGIGIELKDSYFDTAVSNIDSVVSRKEQITFNLEF